MYPITDLQDKQKNMEREISRLRDFVIRLEFCVNVQKDQIVDLKSKSMENNVIITGLQESRDIKEPENLAEIIRNILITEMGMAQEAADNLQISKIFLMGEFHRNKKYPRPVCIQFSNKIHKDMVMSRVSFLKKKQSLFRFAQQPEEIREK